MFRHVVLAAAVAATAGCGAEPCNTAIDGIPGHEMPDVDMPAGDTIGIPLEDHWNLPAGCVESYKEDGVDIFEAKSSDPAVAVWIADDFETLVVAALGVGSARVTVRQDGVGDSVTYEFVVRVAAR